MSEQAASAAKTGLAKLAQARGVVVESAANLPVSLDDQASVWLVLEGAVDVFLFERREETTTSAGRHLLRADAGRLLFGISAERSRLSAVAKGLPDTRLARLRWTQLLGADLITEVGAEVAEQVDRWVSDIGGAVASRIDPRPRPTQFVDPAETDRPIAVSAGDVLSARLGSVVWLNARGCAPAYLGTEEPAFDSTGLIPVTLSTWVTIARAGSAAGATSRELARDGRLHAALLEFHQSALDAEQLNQLLLTADIVNEQTARSFLRRREAELAREGLLGLLDQRRGEAVESDSGLLAALSLIGQHEGIRFQAPARRAGAPDEEPSLPDILHASGVRARRVRLRREDRWWLGDSGAMLGFRREDGRPVALLPHWSGRYRMLDPQNGRARRLSASRADEVMDDAWVCYPSFDYERSVRSTDLLRLARRGLLRELVNFIAIGLIAALLTQAPAIGIGVLSDWVLASASGSMLVQVIVALLAFGLVTVLLYIVQGTALMRIEGRGAARVSAAAWDRLIALPPNFFRRYTAGELAARMATFQLLRDQFSGVVAHALFSFIFLLPTLGLLFAYDAALATVSLLIAVAALSVTVVIGLLQLPAQRRWFAAERRLTGELLQFINGIGKLRGAGAEPSAFASWARSYRDQHLAGIQIARLNEHLIALSAALPAIVAAALFAAALATGGDELAISDFIVAYAVSMTFYAAVVNLGLSFQRIAQALPSYEQVRPVLDELPEPRLSGSERLEVGGDLRFDHVSFRYQEDTPLIEDVSIDARAGEFIAIVGESGSGKSTLMRLALGLEEPNAGSIYYDGRDLAALDRQELRRQLGVVMQDSVLQPGNLLDNIIGMGDELTMEDAWRAARMAGLEPDIQAMPMQMFTVVSDGTTTFSGGQSQRVRIAAALVRNPRLIFLDEATSWLDARTQAEVMRSIEQLAATRIVIAHRLSTIRQADRIYVMERGRVAQVGTFDELYAVEGPFRRLVERQIS